VAVLVADTGYELYSGLGMDEETPEEAMHSVCDPDLPESGEV
jgi:hypothetical protein